MEKSKKKVVIVDGYGFIFRAFFSLADFKTSKGEPVGAVYGFINMILKVLNSLNPEYLIVVFDSGKKTFRSDLYPEYKAHRKEAPDDLKPQFAIVREAVKAMNINFAQTDGFEADDIIATYSKIAEKEGFGCIIVSSDKDLMQLTKDEIIEFYDPMKGKFVKEADVEAKFGVKPLQVRDFLSILGDASDNIPGIKGIGEKGASELLREFNTLEGIYDNLEKITKPRLKKLLEEGREMAFLSQKLASLHFDVKVAPIEEFKLKPFNKSVLYDFLSRYELNSIIAKLVPEYSKAQIDLFDVKPNNEKEEILQITDTKNLKDFLESIKGNQVIFEAKDNDLMIVAEGDSALVKNWWAE
jgi:DNA polymerase-1